MKDTPGIAFASETTVKARDLSSIDRYISRTRLALSLLALVSMYVDPVVGGGPFTIDPPLLGILTLHLAYASAALWYLAGRTSSARRSAFVLAAFDVMFAAMVSVVTEGTTSPAYIFFCFAIIAVSCRAGLTATLNVTVVCMALYLLAILLFHGSAGRLYLMRPAYLGIIGCLAGFLGRERVSFEARVSELEAVAERHRIARSLHDGFVQALAGLNLRLESCRELLVRADATQALEGLTELQSGVTREYDEVRAYIRSLADLDPPKIGAPRGAEPRTHFRIQADFGAGGQLVEEVLQIILEATRNARRHGDARSAIVRASEHDQSIRITIADDGIGFGSPSTPPWSIASRVAESGGSLRIAEGPRRGARLDIELPNE